LRKAHYLTKPRNQQLPNNFYFVDTESEERSIGTTATGRKESEQTFAMGFASYIRRRKGIKFDEPTWKKLIEPKDFWEWIDETLPNKQVAYVFAHNLGYDYPILQGYYILPQLGWTLTNFIIDDPPTIIDYEKCPKMCGAPSGRYARKESGCREPHRKIRMIDTLNYFRMSLKALGASLGTFKLDMPVDSEGRPAKITAENMVEWDEYNMQDVQVLMDAITQYLEFITEHDLGSFQITQASQSFMAFRHKFMKHQILLDAEPKALEVARNSYYGGRVECYKIGQRKGVETYKLDINSMYPFIMRDYEFPTQFANFWKNVSLDEYKEVREKGYLVSAHCDIDTDEPVYPTRTDNKLVFPIGKFSTYLSSPEIDYGIEHGHITKIHSAAMYHSDPIFKDFVTYFYDLRLKAKHKGDERQSFFLKIMMNSLYGKFGQNGRKWKTLDTQEGMDDIKVWQEYDHDTGEIKNLRQMGRVVQQLQTEDESMNSHPSIAAHITAEARMYLWRLMKQAGRENTYYCDTDSLFTNKEGADNIKDVLDDDLLGYLKIEEITDDFELFTLKDYKFGKSVKIKGVRDPSDIRGDNVYGMLQFRGLKGTMREKDFGRIVITRGTKILTRKYTKGLVQPDGWVKPFELDEAIG
jgi:hypothetical protein